MYNLRNKVVNRHCTTETSCRAQDLGRGSCVLSELPSPSTSGGSSVRSSMATATTTSGEEHSTNPSQLASDVSEVTQVRIPQTTKAGKPRKRMKWTQEMNSFIMRSYYKITKFETDMTTYRGALHNAFIEKFPDFRNVTEQRVADQRRTIVKNKLLSEQLLQQIRGEVQLEIQTDEIENQSVTIQTERDTDDREEAGDNNESHEVDASVIINNDNQDIIAESALNELHKALAEFDGTNPIRRPNLPKLRTNKNSTKIITAINSALNDYLVEYDTLEKLHTLIYCSAVAVLRSHKQQILTQGTQRNHKSKNFKPVWQKRLENSINEIRQELGRLTEFTKSEQPSKRLKTKIQKILKKVSTNNSSATSQQRIAEYMDDLKQKLKAKSKRLHRYIKCSKRKRQNFLFNNHQKKFYKELGNISNNVEMQLPSKENITNYWSDIWSKPKEHRRNAEWIEEEKEQRNVPQMAYTNISKEEVTEAIKSTSSWKSPGVDNIQNFWYKKFDSLHEALSQQFTHIINCPEDTPDFLMLGTTYMLPKSARTEDPSQYRPITCLPTLYKILTSCVTNKIYSHVDINNLLAEEQKGCLRKHQGCKEQLIIDSVVLKQAQKGRRNIHTAFIDYRKAFDSVPHSWLLKVLEMYNIHPTIVKFLDTIRRHWRTQLNISNKNQSFSTGEIYIRRGIFQGDSLSPLWFCLALNPLSTMLNNNRYGFNIKANRNSSHTISHLMYMDDIKLYAGNHKHLESLIKITHTFSKDIHMDFGMDKCKTLSIEKGKIVNGEVALPNGDIIQAMEDGETYKYLGFQQARLLEAKQAKSKVIGQYLDRTRSILKSELNSANLVKAINTYAIPVLTYTFGIIKWTKTDLEDIQRKTRTMMTKYKMHHPKSSIFRTTLPRKEGGRALTDIVNLHSRQLLKLREFFFGKAHTSRLHEIIKLADKNYSPLNLSSPDFEITILSDVEKKALWEQKAMHGRHCNDLERPHINKTASNKWLTDGKLFPETEGFMVAIQDQVINTNNYKKFVLKDPNVNSDKCRKCNQKSETIQHITSGCTYLANTDYLHRHNQVCNIVHQKLANKYKLLNTYTPYYKYQPQSVLENDSFKLYYDRTIITDRHVTNNRPDIVLLNKRVKSAYLIDISVPNNNNVMEKYQEKKAKYSELAIEIRKMWHLDKVHIIPIIVSSTGLIPTNLEENLVKLGLHGNTFIDIQKAVILSTCHIVRKFFEGTT